MGVVVTWLTASVGGWDLLPDWAGWLLVLAGTHALPEQVEHRSWLRGLAVAALAVAAVVWVPAVRDLLPGDVGGDSLRWALSLPQVAYVGLLAHVLAGAARDSGDPRAATWWTVVRTVAVVLAVLPVLVFGGGIDALRPVAGAVTALAPLLVVVLLVVHRVRPWAQPDDHPGDVGRPGRSSDRGV
jgi:hypothetical protein